MSELINKILNTKKKICVGMAGPGTGKSYTFKEVVKSKQFEGKKILILSFINKLIDDLKDDFKDFSNVEVSTLHSFAYRVLNSNNHKISIEQNLDIILSEDFSVIKGKDCDYQKLLRENVLDKREEEEKFYRERKLFYEGKGKKLYSYDSVVYALNKVFEKNEGKILQYDLILVDEFQDFNPLECRMVELLSKKSKVVIVGDDDQALYDFKSATPETIREYYQGDQSEVFTLPDCYRCTRIIVEAVRDVVQKAKNKGFLKNRIEKKYRYPNTIKWKNKLSEHYKSIEYKQGVQGDLLFHFLSQKIKSDVAERIYGRWR